MIFQDCKCTKKLEICKRIGEKFLAYSQLFSTFAMKIYCIKT